MSNLIEELKGYFEQNENVRSVICIENEHEFSPLTDGFEVLLLVLCHHYDIQRPLSHYIRHNKRIQERWVDAEGLQRWIAAGENRRIVEWIIRGDVLMDRDSYLSVLKQNLISFPYALREQRLLIEFSAFLRTYLQSKEYLRTGHYMDAFTNILEALHHWARISIIEQGIHPEVTVWEQLRTINVGIYRLYEELILSAEPIEKRIQLLILASEFFAATKIDLCCSPVVRILKSRPQPWSVQELAVHPEMSNLPIDINMLLYQLIKKSMIVELVPMDSDPGFTQSMYTV